MKKPAQVVMLPTNEKAGAVDILIHSNKLSIESPNFHHYNPQHLYILSDEEIKEGDWYYDPYNKQIIKSPYNHFPLEFGECKKIIATTDKSIILPERFPSFTYLPQPPQSFIEHFVAEYNKGNIITDVMVEYENIDMDFDPTEQNGIKWQTILKINSDNTINISIPKDSWSRDEVKQLFDKWNDIVYKGYYVAKKDLETVLDYSDKWIEENL